MIGLTPWLASQMPSPRADRPKKVLVTGATGMLGRAVMRKISKIPDLEATGIGFSRAVPPIRKCDLTDRAAVVQLMNEVKPDIVVHCAAERDPDRADQDLARLKTINVDSAAFLAAQCGSLGARLVYISTDYVFDGGVATGVFPPYQIDSPTGPVNNYGNSKLEGEKAVLLVPEARTLVIRVPVMYAFDCEALKESASLTVAKALCTREPKTLCNWGLRFPTACDDVAAGICALVLKDARGVVHFSSPHSVTKFEMSLVMAELMGVSAEHLTGDSNPPAGAPRPQNTQLDCSGTWQILGRPHEFVTLRGGLARALEPFRDQFHGNSTQSPAGASVPAASEVVSVVVGPMEVRDVAKAAELLAALRAVRDGALSEGRVSEYDVYVTNTDGVVCNDKSNPAMREAGPYFLREIYPSKAAQDAHGKDSEALAAFRTAKQALADFKNPDRAVDIPRATVTEGKVVSEEEFLATAKSANM